MYSSTDVTFSPDDQLVMTGLSTKRGEGVGRLVFMDRQNLQPVSHIDVIEGQVNTTHIYYYNECIHNSMLIN